MHTFQMTIGDWSDDGHGKKETLTILSVVPHDEIYNAYLLSCKQAKIVFHDYVASSFEDDAYPVEKFRELGCPEEFLLEDFVEDPRHYFELFRWFCSLSTPGIEKLFDTNPNVVDLAHLIAGQFGYGLF